MAFTNPKTPKFSPYPGGSKRPYTRRPSGPTRPPDVGDVAARIHQGTKKPTYPGQTDPNTYGPRQPDLTNVGAQGSQQAPSPQQTAGAAAAVGAKADALAQYVSNITDPKERAYVEAQIGPQIAALNAQRDALMAQAKDQQAQMQALTQALVAQLGSVIGGIGGAYTATAGHQKAMGHAAGQSLSNANTSDATNAVLGALGAPGSQQAQVSAANADVFGAGGDVLEGTGGTLPAYVTTGEGQGATAWAQAQPTMAAMYGQNYLSQLQGQQRQALNQYNSDLQGILGGIPKYASDYESQTAAEQKAKEDRAMTLYNAGMLTQRDLARALNLPNWQKYPAMPKGSASKPIVTTGNNGHRIVIDPSTGKVIADYGPTTAPKPVKAPGVKGSLATGLWRENPDGSVTILSPPKSPNLSFQTINGHVWVVDPTTGRKVRNIGVAGTPKTNKNGTPKSMAGGLLIYNPMLNKGKGGYQPKPGYGFGPGGAIVKLTPPKKAQILGAGGQPLSPSEINRNAAAIGTDLRAIKAGKDTITATVQRWKDAGIPEALWVPRLVKMFGAPRDISQLKYMNTNRLHQIASVVAPEDFARAVPPRKGGFSKSELIQFIEGHIGLPKVNAAAETAANRVGGNGLVAYAAQQLGQPYKWGAESRKEGGFDCSGLVDYALRQEGYTGPRVTTYTLAKMGTSVKGQPLQPGDLLIVNHGEHVVMYAGNGQVIAAPHTGAKVQYQPVSRFEGSTVDVRRIGSLGPQQGGPPANQNVSATSTKAPVQQVSLANKYGAMYHVDPRVLLAIAAHETQYGSLGAGRNGYALGYGVTDSGTYSKYRGVVNQYKYAAQLLAKWGVHPIQDILNGRAKAYASDPGWERGVAAAWRSMGGSYV